MKQRYDLGTLDWTLAGWTPYVWRQQRSIEAGVSNNAEVPGVPARVPGSVQGALREAGILPDWNVGLNARLCEWVENRHWIYTARLPLAWLSPGTRVRLNALGLDYSGWVLLNGTEIGRFRGSLIPHMFDLTPHLHDQENTLQIVFDCPPRWLGQIGYTSEMKEWKERFNYFWDWTSRLVQLGIWDDLLLEVIDGAEFTDFHCVATAEVERGSGSLRLRGLVFGEPRSDARYEEPRVGRTPHGGDVPARREPERDHPAQRAPAYSHATESPGREGLVNYRRLMAIRSTAPSLSAPAIGVGTVAPSLSARAASCEAKEDRDRNYSPYNLQHGHADSTRTRTSGEGSRPGVWDNLTVSVELERDGRAIHREDVTVERFMAGITWVDFPVDFWWPNGTGNQPLYTLTCTLLDPNGETLDTVSIRVGFKQVEWAPCEGAPPEAGPWLCVVNGRPTFLQGVNWTPILPNFADVTEQQYRRLLETYRDLGCNTLRVWGGAFLEKEVFYDLCDELGLLVWQEFPLSSSGLDNDPPDDPASVEQMAAIAESYVKRRRNHVCLTLWCGGNELQSRDGRPLDLGHPMLARLAEVVATDDPQRRFLPTSPSGPTFGAEEDRFGQGVHWDVHGPWRADGDLNDEWTRFWANNDALFHSEIGAPGASPVDIIRRYKGDLAEAPGTSANPLWRRTGWWIEWPAFVEEVGREPTNLEEYVAWSQERQGRTLAIAARSAKSRFPRCGGFLIWMGHDSFPCTANTSIVDFHGAPKPAALEIGTIFRGEGSSWYAR